MSDSKAYVPPEAACLGVRGDGLLLGGLHVGVVLPERLEAVRGVGDVLVAPHEARKRGELVGHIGTSF